MTCANNDGSTDGTAYACPNSFAAKTGATSCADADCVQGDCCDGVFASAVVWGVPLVHLTPALLVREP